MKHLIFGLFVYVILLAGGCQLAQQGVTTWEGEAHNWQAPAEMPLRLYVFLSPECPLCENYSLTLTRLRERFAPDSVGFYGVFPGTYYSREEIGTYLKQYKPAVIPLLDPTYELTHVLGATVTPEAFLLDEYGTVLYSGQIDNWAPKLGTKRSVITRHYLADAILAAQKGKPTDPAYTRPVGCFIE